ncbi:hypothetical protein FFLO_05012 [Filobasidium floriforme]|uniref:Uncharacterized protein n=1 Tax=Filobasidium floriforme TaxID=5210 RepID=A0A8K0NNN1_9TREE|nr:uncharacterized protein HD553DRAFT_201545 [Filobasidium floriforme]KAG7530471.1 hypothetical protein FFLO_05012 [Filobasidium floriforme]KAH8087545.1 hypothetical protein HD553DRAFT_201545 [Filobasidium floriforme]
MAHPGSPLKQWIKLHRQQSSHPNVAQGEVTADLDEESEGYTPVPTAAEPVAIDTQVRTDGTTATRKVEIELGDPAVATHISAAAGEAKKNDRGETLDALFSRFLGESSAGRGMSTSTAPVRTDGPATPSQIASQEAQETSQGNAMQALLAKLASPAVTNASVIPTYASPAPPSFPTAAYAMPPVQPHAPPGQVHARNLLSMLSPKAPPAAVNSPTNAPLVNYASHPPPALIASARPPDDKEIRRKALLDNMMAGLGGPTSQQPNHMTGGSPGVHYMSSSHQHPQPSFPPIQGLPRHVPPPQLGPASFSSYPVPPHLAGPHQMPPPGPPAWSGNVGGPPPPMHLGFNGHITGPPPAPGPQYPQAQHPQGMPQMPAHPPPMSPTKQRDAGDLLNALLGPRPPG